MLSKISALRVLSRVVNLETVDWTRAENRKVIAPCPHAILTVMIVDNLG